MSEFLSQIMGGLSGLVGAAGSMGGLLAQLLGTAEGATAGALPTILAQLETAGFGPHVQSWAGGEQKLPVTAADVMTAIPPDQLERLAAQLEVTPAQLAGMLAEVLPHATNQAAQGTDPSSVSLRGPLP